MSRITSGNNGITQQYKPLTHKGVDIGWHNDEKDNIVLAHSEGIVVAIVSNIKATYKTGSSYGNYIKIKHPNGYYTLYAHLKYESIKVKVNQKVSKGQEIAIIGATGHAIGRHLHFEVRNEKDTRINPTPYINDNLPNMNDWEKGGKYQTLVAKYVRKTPEVSNNNKIKYKNITINKDKYYADKNGNAKTRIGETFELTDFKKDKKGNVWGKLRYDWICVQDSTGNQVKRV